MKNKWLLIILIVVALISLFLVGLYFTKDNEIDYPQNDVTIEEEKSKYAMEQKNDIYNVRVLESDNKEYVTLYIETNIFENEKEVLIKYDNSKYILNTANIFLQNVEIEKGDTINSFKFKLSQLTNYSMLFIKKSLANEVEVNDIAIENIN